MRNRYLKLRVAVAALFGAALLINVSSAQTGKNSRQAEVALEAAIDKEFTDGDLTAAIAQYQRILTNFIGSRAVAAKALLRLALAYESLHRTEEARTNFDRLARDYAADQPKLAAEARQHLKTFADSFLVSTAATKRPPASILSRAQRGLWDAVTPDGRSISDGGPGRLVLRDIQTGKERVITDSGPSGDRVEHIAFSNDGKLVAYTWFVASSTSYELRTLPVDVLAGTQPSVLIGRSAKYNHNMPFGWNPDRTTVFAILTDKDGAHWIASVSLANGDIQILHSLEWRWPDRLSVSPDGRYISYDAPVAKESTDRDIFVLSTAGGAVLPIVQGAARDALPVWTPDGQAVVFASDRSGTVGLWIVQVTDGKAPRPPEPILRNTGALFPLGFSRDGSFYYAAGTAGADVYIDEAINGTVQAARIDQFSGHNSRPAYSPDGGKLAYFSSRGPGFLNAEPGVRGFLTLVIRSLASREEQTIATSFTEVSGVSWSPDGQSLVFAGRSNGAPEPYALHRFELQTGRDLIRKTIETDEGSYTCVAQDGKIYYTRQSVLGKQRIMIYDMQSQQVTEMFETAGTGAKVGTRLLISPDGKRIAFTLLDGKPAHWTVRVMPLSGGPSTELQDPLAELAGKLTAIQWSTAGDEVQVQRANGVLWWIPVSGEKAYRAGYKQYQPIQSISPDGKRLAFERSDSRWEVSVEPDLLRPDADRSDIFSVSIDPNGARVHGPAIRLTQNLVFSDKSPMWSPDGQSVAFKRRHLGNNPGSGFDVVIRSVKTGEEHTAYAPIGAVPPRWLPDGKSILVGGNSVAVGRLVLDVKTFRYMDTLWVNYSSVEYMHFGGGAISPEGSSIFLPARDRQNSESREGVPSVYDRIAVLDLTGGAEIRSFPVSGRVSMLGLSRDGLTLALVSLDDVATGKAHLARIGTDGKGYLLLYSFHSMDGALMNPVWTKDGSGILFAQLESDDKLRIMRYAIATKKVEFTGLAIGRSGYGSIDLSPDGTHLIFSARARSVSIVAGGSTR